jgi:hypothetical protein
MSAANFDAWIVALRRQAERIQADLQRVNNEIGEIEQQRREMTDVADKARNDSVLAHPVSAPLLPAERTPVALPPPEEEDKGGKYGPGPNPLDDDIPFDF